MKFSDAKKTVATKSAGTPTNEPRIECCEECGCSLPVPEKGRGNFRGIPIGGGRYICPDCHTALYAKQYMPSHPKADSDGFVRVSDLLGSAVKKPQRLKMKALPYDRDYRETEEEWR